MLIIKEVLKGGLGDRAELKPGDKIVEVNNQKIRDEIDLKYYSAEDFLKIKILRDKIEKVIEINKGYYKSIGVEFDEMNIYSCGTECIFCFVNQNPPGLRKTIYFKDGDYRMSFLYGNYITLTNIGHNALNRIVAQRLSPLYVSIHSTIPEIRQYYMGLKKDDKILDKLRYLVENNIKIHAQIVLSPEINDSVSLFKTIDDLFDLSNGVESLAIVPVGLTKHRKGLAKIKRINKIYANELIENMSPTQKKIRNLIGKTWVYLSDEFYLLSKMEIPDTAYYDDFPQIENGVGMVRKFYEQFVSESKRFPQKLSQKKKVTLATGTLAYNFIINRVLPLLRRIKNLDIEIVSVKNRLFGSNVTVSGLLSMGCLYNGLKRKNLGNLLVLPENIVNYDGIFLDDGTPEELGRKLNTKVYVFKKNWKELFKYTENL